MKSSVRTELIQRFGMEAADVYVYAACLSAYWHCGASTAPDDKEALASCIREASRRFAVDTYVLDAFLNRPCDSTRNAILEPVFAYFEIVTVCLSYSRGDSAFVDRLAGNIQKSKVRVRVAVKETDIGFSVTDALAKGIEASDVFCPVVSTHSSWTSWLPLECRAAINAKTYSGAPRIVPLVLDPVDVPDFLQKAPCADFSRSFDEGLLKLSEEIQRTA